MAHRVLVLLVTMLAAASGVSAQAQEWPARQAVRIIAPFAPGGSSDVLGRAVAQKLGTYFNQQFVVENKPGAGGLVGSEQVLHAAPDGYMLLVSGVGPLVVSPAIADRPTFDPIADFTHIATFGGPPAVFVVGKDVPAKTLKEFVDLAKAKPGYYAYGSSGIGTHAHLIAELFQQKAGIKLIHAPYGGGAQAMVDLMGGRIASASTALTSAAETIRSGAARGLALTASKRVPDFADISTYAELGYPELTATTWFALAGPAKMPADIVNKLNAGVLRAFREPDVKQRLEREAIDPEPFTPAQFTEFVRAEVARWTPIAKASGAKLQ